MLKLREVDTLSVIPPPLETQRSPFIANTANLLPTRPGELFSIKAALMYASSSPRPVAKHRERSSLRRLGDGLI